MTTMKRARAVADLSRGVVHAVVEIAAPPARVFRALTDPNDLPAWWGSPDTYQVTEFQSDLRVGGAWKSVGRGHDGAAFAVGGEYLEIDAPRLLTHTWKPDWEAGEPTVVRYELDAIEGGTRVTVRHDGFGARIESCRSHGDGWERVLGWLVKHVTPAESAQYFLCRLLPPRPSFMLDMTAEEAKLMGEHAMYWAGLAQKGVAIAFGPVADPKGGWGVGLVTAPSEDDVRALEAGDPVIRSAQGFRYEILRMPRLVRAPV